MTGGEDLNLPNETGEKVEEETELEVIHFVERLNKKGLLNCVKLHIFGWGSL